MSNTFHGYSLLHFLIELVHVWPRELLDDLLFCDVNALAAEVLNKPANAFLLCLKGGRSWPSAGRMAWGVVLVRYLRLFIHHILRITGVTCQCCLGVTHAIELPSGFG